MGQVNPRLKLLKRGGRCWAEKAKTSVELKMAARHIRWPKSSDHSISGRRDQTGMINGDANTRLVQNLKSNAQNLTCAKELGHKFDT
jgi:hypothetical protein